MNYQHKELSVGRWERISFMEQMANLGSEVERAINWREKNKDYARRAFMRQLELLDFTISDAKNLTHLKELTRLRELLIDYFAFDNQYNSSDKLWRNYFYPFNFAARRGS